MRKLTKEQFIQKAREIHGDKYDYSKVQYINNRNKVCIVCPKHGEFWMLPTSHTDQKQGCRKCYEDNKRVGIIGIGKMDIGINKHNKDEYRKYLLWKNMIVRVYNTKYHQHRPTYINCSVCEEWLTFSNFKRWIEDPKNGYQEGYHLDKDILIKGNKVYSPDYCCFVPPLLNSVFTKRQRFRGKCPIGVTYDGMGYVSTLSTIDGCKYLGYYKKTEDAFDVYKNAKESYVKELAESYFKEGKITEKVYHALMKYEVEITD